jgi:hypothetical protein
MALEAIVFVFFTVFAFSFLSSVYHITEQEEHGWFLNAKG